MTKTSAELKKAKSLLRKELRHKLQKLTPASRKRKSQKIIQKLIRSSLFQKSQKILAYRALPREVQTRELIREALLQKKQVYLPRLDMKKGVMEAFQILKIQKDLKKNKLGIWEPKKKVSRQGSPKSFDLVIVPGLGFDRKARRLGRGGGHYDRFLKRAIRARKIGLAFREQVVLKVPTGAHDVVLDDVLID